MVASRPPDFTDAEGVAWAFALLRPSGFGTFVLADPEAALDQAVASDDLEGPYFGTVWPSGRVLAEQILDGHLAVSGRVCDLGCGVGVVGLAALCMGAQVTFVDAAARGFTSVRAAARVLELPEPPCVEANWELDTLDASFDVLLAADVLYHSIARLPVARFAVRHLAPGGSLWVADPGRAPAARFPEDAASVGLPRVTVREVRDSYSNATVVLSQYMREAS